MNRSVRSGVSSFLSAPGQAVTLIFFMSPKVDKLENRAQFEDQYNINTVDQNTLGSL